MAPGVGLTLSMHLAAGHERRATKPPVSTRMSLALSAAKRKGKRVLDVGRELGEGVASWYGPRFHGRRTASGEVFDRYALTAAHKTLPLGTRVVVSNPRTGKQVVVRINDRGPYLGNRMLDLSEAAASALGLKARGQDWVVMNAVLPPTAQPGESDATGYAVANGATSGATPPPAPAPEVAQASTSEAPVALMDTGRLPVAGRPPKSPTVALAKAPVTQPVVPPAPAVSAPEPVKWASDTFDDAVAQAAAVTEIARHPVAQEAAELKLASVASAPASAADPAISAEHSVTTAPTSAPVTVAGWMQPVVQDLSPNAGR